MGALKPSLLASRAFPRALMFILLTVVPTSLQFQQQFTVYEDTRPSSNYMVFRSAVPDTSVYTRYTKSTYFCFQGLWVLCGEKNYGSCGSALIVNRCSRDNDQSDVDFFRRFQSFRYMGSSETTRQAVSLYAETFYSGQETLVEGWAYGGITGPIRSAAYTGRIEWTFFEGLNFDGASFCFKQEWGLDWTFTWKYDMSHIPLAKIGSVLKGCPENPSAFIAKMRLLNHVVPNTNSSSDSP